MPDTIVTTDLATGKTTTRQATAQEQATIDTDRQAAATRKAVEDGRQANRASLEQRMDAYLALVTPTQAQNAKAIKGLIRYVRGLLADISDT